MPYTPAAYAHALIETHAARKLSRPASRRFFEIVRKNGHSNWLPEIFERLRELSYRARGARRIELTAARSDGKKFIPSVRRLFGRKADIQFSVKPELLGGIVLKIDGETMIDASVRRQLDQMFTKN